MEISSRRPFQKVHFTEFKHHRTIHCDPQNYTRKPYVTPSKGTVYYFFKAAHLTFLLLVSHISLSAVVYTVTSIYPGRDISFKNVMSVAPRVWKRLVATLLIILLATVIAVYTLITSLLTEVDGNLGPVKFNFMLTLLLTGFVNMSIMWRLATVVTIVDDMHSFKAMIKNQDFIKGKMGLALFIFFRLIMSYLGIQFLVSNFVVRGEMLDMSKRMGFVVLSFLFLYKLVLFGLVIQTIMYFVCKCYYHDNVDASSFLNHLEAYLWTVSPMTMEDLQFENTEV